MSAGLLHFRSENRLREGRGEAQIYRFEVFVVLTEARDYDDLISCFHPSLHLIYVSSTSEE